MIKLKVFSNSIECRNILVNAVLKSFLKNPTLINIKIKNILVKIIAACCPGDRSALRPEKVQERIASVKDIVVR